MTSFGIFWRSATSSKPTTSQICTMPFCAPAHMTEEIRDRGRTSQQRCVRRHLLDDIALAGASRTEFDQVVVPLARAESAGSGIAA